MTELEELISEYGEAMAQAVMAFEVGFGAWPAQAEKALNDVIARLAEHGLSVKGFP